MNAIALLAALLIGQAEPYPVVEQTVDTIAVCHVCGENGGFSLIFFFDRVQGEWTCLDHRWLAADMEIACDSSRDGAKFTLAWRDDSDACYCIIRAAAWVESWERESPLAGEQNKPWHARLLEPGLKKARGPF